MDVSRFKTKPYEHQLECLNKFGRSKYFALLAEMGTGKTWIVINNIADLWANGEVTDVLVLAPNGVHTNWTLLELGKHMPDWVRWKSVAWTSSKRKADLAAIESLYERNEDGTLRIFTMNWEALQTPRGFKAAERFAMTSGRLMIVCDESDAIKNPSAKRTKNLLKLKAYSNYRRIMTGTPINNAPFDAFSQFNFLHKDILETTSFYAFKAEYAEMLEEGNPLLDHIKTRSGSRRTPQVVAKGPGGQPKYRNLDKLSRLIAPHSFRVLKKDCVDLPDKIYKTAIFELTPQQKEAYKLAAEQFRLAYEGDETPFNKLTAAMKLAQITSGYYLHPDSDTPIRIEGDNPKLDILTERVKQIAAEGKKVIIWARYRVEIADICARLKEAGIKFVEYHGGVKKADRPEMIDQFQDGDAVAFVGNQQAGGTGITLTAASFVIYFSNNFSLRDRLQSEDRAHRIGQKENVVYLDILGRGTIDEHVIRRVHSKQDVAKAIVDDGLAMVGSL